MGCPRPRDTVSPTGPRALGEADSKSGKKAPEGTLELGGTARGGELAEAPAPELTGWSALSTGDAVP